MDRSPLNDRHLFKRVVGIDMQTAYSWDYMISHKRTGSSQYATQGWRQMEIVTSGISVLLHELWKKSVPERRGLFRRLLDAIALPISAMF